MFRAEQIVAFLVHFGGPSLRVNRLRVWVNAGEQRHGAHAIPFPRGEQHPGVTRVNREGEHPAA